MNESHETTASKLKYKNNQWVASQGDENWLVVLNPEIINKLPIPAQNHLPDTTDKIFPQEGIEYDWPSTMELKKDFVDEHGISVYNIKNTGYILSLPETTASGDTAKQGEATLGVGDGTGQHFVHAQYETIKLLQSKILRWEKIEEENTRAWNAAVEHCIVKLGNSFPEYGNKEFSITGIRKELESLKIKE
jgi:hypothetical protein